MATNLSTPLAVLTNLKHTDVEEGCRIYKLSTARGSDEDKTRPKVVLGNTTAVGLKSWMIFHSEAILEIMASVVELFVGLCSSGS